VRKLDGEHEGRAEEAVVEGLRQDHVDKEPAERGREVEELQQPEAKESKEANREERDPSENRFGKKK